AQRRHGVSHTVRGIDRGGQSTERGRIKKAAQIKIDMQALTHPSGNLHSGNRVAAKHEEVILAADFRKAKHILPDQCKTALGFCERIWRRPFGGLLPPCYNL